MSYHQKYQILSNELVRRFSNIDTSLPHKEVLTAVDQYIIELKTSGYSKRQARDIVSSGIRGWKRKHKKRNEKSIPFYRLAETTIKTRLRKEIIEKES